jgi:hypothetical protein
MPARAGTLTLAAAAALLWGCPQPAPIGDGCTFCGSSCVDTLVDAQNCGACGHDCQGGACLAGACQPVTLFHGTGCAKSSAYGGLASDAENLYWTDESHGVASLPLSGGTLKQLVSYDPSCTLRFGGIAAGSADVYWTDINGGSILDAAKDEATQTPASFAKSPNTPRPYNIVVDATYAYWTNNGDGTVLRASLDQKNVQVLAADTTDGDGPYAIAIDAENVYWTNLASSRRPGRGGRCSRRIRATPSASRSTRRTSTGRPTATGSC